MNGLVQLDLFGMVERAAQAAVAWAARFERADWIAPHDTASGRKKGDRLLAGAAPTRLRGDRTEPALGVAALRHPQRPPNRNGRAHHAPAATTASGTPTMTATEGISCATILI